jgi:lipoprotein-anchoring transpeptidase ErfK/SrfK
MLLALPPIFQTMHIVRISLLAAAATLFSACSTVDRFMPSTGEGRVVKGAARVKIDLSAQRAYLYKKGAVIAESRISTGRDGYETPVGRFKIAQKDKDHRSSLYGDYVNSSGRIVMGGVDTRRHKRPPGTTFRGASMPYFLRFNGAIGMHAGNVKWFPSSHGCVRLPIGMAQTFYRNVSVGTPVMVTH